MELQPFDMRLELEPQSRFDVIDVTRRLEAEIGDSFRRFKRTLYCSHHTTAGFLEPALARRLGHDPRRVDPFIQAFQQLFPAGADSLHDRMDLRSELSDEQRSVEPPNADAHLTFIGSGLQSCVTYVNRSDTPVLFMDLDGEYQGRRRIRTTTVTAYNHEREIAAFQCEVPVSHHTIDSINLNEAALGLDDRINDLVRRHGIGHGRVDIALDPSERSTAVTVNEYETLLMRHDLAEVLRDPLRYMARQGRNVLRDPRAVPTKTLDYAKYDVVRVMNRLIDALGLGNTAFERLVSRMMAVPAERRLRFKRSLSLGVGPNGDGASHVVRGRYQSPILIQWESTPRRARTLNVTVHGFE